MFVPCVMFFSAGCSRNFPLRAVRRRNVAGNVRWASQGAFLASGVSLAILARPRAHGSFSRLSAGRAVCPAVPDSGRDDLAAVIENCRRRSPDVSASTAFALPSICGRRLAVRRTSGPSISRRRKENAVPVAVPGRRSFDDLSAAAMPALPFPSPCRGLFGFAC